MEQEYLERVLYAVDPLTRENLEKACVKYIGDGSDVFRGSFQIEENEHCFFVRWYPGGDIRGGGGIVTIHK
jgi:hypothetical protein